MDLLLQQDGHAALLAMDRGGAHRLVWTWIGFEIEELQRRAEREFPLGVTHRRECPPPEPWQKNALRYSSRVTSGAHSPGGFHGRRNEESRIRAALGRLAPSLKCWRMAAPLMRQFQRS